MCSHCDKALCRTRKHGIGNSPTFPELSDLQEIQLEHPYYYLNVDGKRLKLDSAKHLRQQSLFEEACIGGVGMLPPTLKTKDWKGLINNLLATREIVEAPEGMKTEDQLREHLEDYCSDRRQTKRKEDIEEEMFGVMKVFITLNLDISSMIIYKEDDGLMIIKKLQHG